MKKIGIHLIPDFSKEFELIFKIWNQCQDKVQFYGLRPKRSHEIRLLTDSQGNIHSDEAFEIGYKVLEEISSEMNDIIILFTEKRLSSKKYYQLYFNGMGNVSILSLNFSKNFFGSSEETRNMIFQSILINILTTISHKFGIKSHKESRVCIMDFLNYMPDIVDIINSGTRYCDSCNKKILKKHEINFLSKLAASTSVIPDIDKLSKSVSQNLYAEKVRTSEPENSFDYDVALSFAGEDRSKVEELANKLKSYGLKVFYDSFEKAKLWGQNLYVYLSDIYRLKARYCVMFISESYKEKLWTNHERESAQNRAFHENGEYILPIRIDETEIPGILDTTGYLNWDRDGVNLIFDCIVEKLKT